ncbi:MAG: cobaltochelatase subunit CobT, partial [Alphaproteobacteria bacterium]|nr:cobaltochelatase subunit CobT [Alphaproteobacteria bacterium]
MTKAENPSEPFKRAVAVAVRSIAGEPELEVNFSAEPPSLKGLKAKLPLPSRNLPPGEVAVVRGAGDAYALRRAYHQDKLHDQYRPQSAEGAAMFEAAEQARVEAIGALAMKGVAKNLAAGLEQRCNARGLAKARVRADVPIAEALGLMVREKLTGEAPPESARNAVSLWREWIESRAGKDLDKLGPALRDQKAFARLTRTILKDLNFGDDSDLDSESDDSGDEAENSENQNKDAEEDADAQGETSEADLKDAEGEDAEDADAEMRAEPSDELGDAAEPDDAMKPWRPEPAFAHQDEWGYKIYTERFDETIEAE